MTKSMIVPDFRNSLRNLSIGLDETWEQIWESLKSHTENSSNYPPYNILKFSKTEYAIEIALAGFAKEEIDIEMESGILKVSGKSDSRYNQENYVYRGIGTRQFTKSWTLAEHVVVRNATFVDGILRINLEIIIPEDKKPKKILITSK